MPSICCHIFGFVDEAWLRRRDGETCLAVKSPVTRKNYNNYSSADADICLDLYMKMDAQNEDGCPKRPTLAERSVVVNLPEGTRLPSEHPQPDPLLVEVVNCRAEWGRTPVGKLRH